MNTIPVTAVATVKETGQAFAAVRKSFFGILLLVTSCGAHVEKAADIKFSVARGFYDTNFSVEITCATPGASVRYTTNCFEPDGGNSFLYTGPVRISKTTVLRAAAF